MARKNVLGIDFGTTNSYFCKCPGDTVQPRGIDFGTGRDGIATAVLYRGEREPLVGDEALQEWGEAGAGERAGYELRIHFKPDVAVGGPAAEWATDFLRHLLAQWERRHVDLAPTHRQVIFGVPSEAGEGYAEALRRIAEGAGYGRIRTLAEPIGALLHHLQHRDLSPAEAQHGILVADFGGGTCDLAYMCRLEVRHAWGDMHLGGRLFDDLFFQWFMECSPDAADAIEEQHAGYYVHWHECRLLKEFFSLTMARDRSQTVRKRIGAYGTVDGLTWEGFLERARRYRPTDAFRAYLDETGGALEAPAGPDGAIDLIGWFRDTLANGLDANGIRPADVQRVILAGGSSQWPFVADVIGEVLHLDAGAEGRRLLRSDRPYAAVGEGLAMLPALQHRSEHTQAALRAGLTEFMNVRVGGLIERRVGEVADEIGRAAAGVLYDGHVRPILEDFRGNGGSFASLRHRVEAAVKDCESDFQRVVTEHVALLEKGLPEQVRALVADWFAEHDLPPTREMLHVDVADFPALPARTAKGVPHLHMELVDAIGVLLAGAIACIGIGLGPIGWGATGAALGLGAGLHLFGRKKAGRWIAGRRVPRPLLRMAMSTRRLTKILTRGRDAAETEIARAVRNHMDEPVLALRERIRLLVGKEIDSLSAIDQL